MITNPPTTRAIVTGTYTGDGSNDRQILVGFPCTMVVLFARVTAASRKFILLENNTNVLSPGNLDIVTVLHATDGFLVSNGGAVNSNINAVVYDWWAISD